MAMIYRFLVPEDFIWIARQQELPGCLSILGEHLWMGAAKFARADGDFGSQYPAKLEKYALSALF